MEIEPSVSTIEKSFSFLGDRGWMEDASKRMLFRQQYFKRSFFFRPLEQVCIKIFLLEMEF